jgi:RimJ/RimL family protein N-acetyltransferase
VLRGEVGVDRWRRGGPTWPFRGQDFTDYAAMNADPEIQRYRGSGPEPWDPGRSWRHLAFLVGHWQLGGAGAWALEHRRTGAFVDYVGFSAPAGWPGFELAWALARSHWGNGYATEGARAALAWAFADPRRGRVVRLVHPENRASLRVAERIGETLEGRVEHFGREMLWYGVDRAGCGGRVDGETRWVPEVWVAP